MFCHACGAKNLAESRFCNQCGVPFAKPAAVQPAAPPQRPSASSLDSTQLGVAGAAEAARAVAAAEQAAAAGRASVSSTPIGLPVVPVDVAGASAPTPALAPVPAPVASSFPMRDEPPVKNVGPVLSVTSSHSLRDESLRKVGFDPNILNDPSVSLHLASLGIVSKRKTWTILIGGAVAFLLLGGIATYVATRHDEAPQGTAHEGDPFTIGAPTPDVDYVSGSSDPNTPTLPATRDAGRPAPTPTTGSTTTPHEHGTTGSTTTGSLPQADPLPITGTTTTTTGSTTTGTTETTTGSTTTGTTETTGSTTTGTTETTDPALEMEMYSGRVRYLVRRYYSGRAQSCFNDATGRNPSLSGQVVLSIHIGADGQVSGAHVRSNTTGDDGLGACLASQANGWQVGPPPAGETDMSFPFSR